MQVHGLHLHTSKDSSTLTNASSKQLERAGKTWAGLSYLASTQWLLCALTLQSKVMDVYLFIINNIKVRIMKDNIINIIEVYFFHIYTYT